MKIEDFIDNLKDNGLTREETTCITFKSVMSHIDVDQTRKDYWVQEYLNIARQMNYPSLYDTVFDYLGIPVELSLKERIAYYNLIKEQA